MSHPGRTRAGWFAAVLVGILLTPATAAGHVRSGIAATDYLVTVNAFPPPLASAVSARISKGDRALALTVRSGHSVVVLGSSGEPFLRLDANGVAVNEASPTATALGLVGEQTPAGGTVWEATSSGSTYTWHDDRLRRLPPGVEQARWGIPLVVDGERVSLEGELRRVAAPPPGPWLAVAGGFAALTAFLVLVRRRSRLRGATVALGALTAVATTAIAVGFAVDPEASAGTWVESVNELALALLGLAVLAFGSHQARVAACGLLGLLGIFAGLLKLEVLDHGVVLASLPATAARAAVIVAISAGAAATVVAAVAFERDRAADSHDESVAAGL